MIRSNTKTEITTSGIVRQKRRRKSKPVLIHEILTLQIMITGAIGAIAIASLYWGGQWVLQDNYNRWALQWTEELNELGAPLYLPNDDEVILRLESYVERYPEIGNVTYYQPDGAVMTAIDKRQTGKAATPLSVDRVQAASGLVGASEPYLIQNSFINPRQFEILAPVSTASIDGDGLIGFDPGDSQSESTSELIGFVGLQLDFVMFHDSLLANIRWAVLALFAILLISALYGRHALRKALTSITDLQKPLAELARGNLNVRFKPAAHREISEIVEALESTAKALGQRDAKLLKLANHDILTGLFNRRRLVEELKKELVKVSGGKTTSSLLFIDLDQFKYVNDTCGHPAGDRLIRKVADQLRRSVGKRGQVARFGGDEFVVLASNTSKQATKALAMTILEDMRRLAHIEDRFSYSLQRWHYDDLWC